MDSHEHLKNLRERMGEHVTSALRVFRDLEDALAVGLFRETKRFIFGKFAPRS